VQGVWHCELSLTFAHFVLAPVLAPATAHRNISVLLGPLPSQISTQCLRIAILRKSAVGMGWFGNPVHLVATVAWRGYFSLAITFLRIEEEVTRGSRLSAHFIFFLF
jgi:hypothetical protein